jgi:hypothetical protein
MGADVLLPVLRAAHRPPEAPQKTLPPPNLSRWAACKATRGVACRCVSARFVLSAGAWCWLRSSKWSAFWPGPHGAAGIRGARNIGSTHDAPFHNCNCSTSDMRDTARSLALVPPLC